ncbi:3-methyladenine DNA glycosylase [Arthrobacter ginkgonis]|uniref:3-methyladenine DNA glycosylase n=1 Tax=Arthrobacter ginkgonis TaxID=1630594 RepID=UPI0031F04D1C
MTAPSPALSVLPPKHLAQDEWLPRAEAHRARVERFAAPFVERRMAGKKHPIEDFLFTYYTHKPGQLQRWHPGAGVVLEGPAAAERLAWKFYAPAGHDGGARAPRSARPGGEGAEGGSGAVLDAAEFASARAEAVRFARIILAGTAARPAQFSCFGLHEWAMAYRSAENGIRHEYLPLRLGAAGTDRVVEEHRIRCTHFDAFRFYAPQAAPLNELQPTRETQRELEQPGCLHANMDLYKWAYKLTPAVPSELLMDCFELAWEIRTMDMRASPYDLSDWGHAPIRIETAEGKAEYVRAQKRFAERADVLRARLLEVAEALSAPGSNHADKQK